MSCSREGVRHLDVVLEDVGGAADGRHVVHDELAVRREEVAPLVQLLDASLVLTICNPARMYTCTPRAQQGEGKTLRSIPISCDVPHIFNRFIFQTKINIC